LSIANRANKGFIFAFKLMIMEQNISFLLDKMCDKNEDESYVYADKLATIGTEEVVDALITVLKGEDLENAYLAARALKNIEDNQKALEPMLELIHQKSMQNKNGVFVDALEGFDLSEHFVDVFRIYLFGNFKSSLLAKEYLDFVEFNITPRVVKKAEKHWNHFLNNSSPTADDFLLKKEEAEMIISEINSLFEEEN
jgi:hypothetical protein